MNFNANIVTPIPTLTSGAQIGSEPKLSPEENASESSERPDNAESLKILGSSLTGTFALRRNSAFSIYEPNLDLDNVKNEEEHDLSSFSSESMEHQPKRSWKREKKDKREMSRLETKNLNRYFRSKIN